MMPANPLAVTVEGVLWTPFVVDFDTQEGPASFHLFAVNLAHAIERLEELKATARIGGELIEVVRAGGPG